MAPRSRRALLAGLLLTLPAPAALLRDAHTGLAVDAAVRLELATGQTATIDAAELTALPADVVALSATGYQTLQLPPQSAPSLPLTILLTPSTTPDLPAARPERIQLRGHVVDATHATPVSGARIQWVGAEAVSDRRGRYTLDLPAPKALREHDSATLRVDHPDYPQWQQPRRTEPGSSRWLVIALGTPPATEHRWQAESAAAEALTAEADSPRLDNAAPPASIRVGFADAACSVPCCTGSCSNVCVLDFETYVRRGLDDEWIASWPAAALTAGAVAYRAYGAWRQANPIRPSFDVCSSACCQVNDADTATSTDAAVAATSGILLIRGGTRFAAEYSAENNSWDDPNDGLSCTNSDLSCGNGFAGSPATGWPCLADAVGSGWGCFGHGRGMSQWGTRGWALAGWRWPRIVDHYYNASGTGSGLRSARMSSPVTIGAPELPSANVAPGGTLLLQLPLTHLGGAPLPRVIQQTLLRRAGSDWSDPATDRLHTLAPGDNLLSREFTVPTALTLGPVALLNRLWLDADADGRVSADDLLLVERSDPARLTIRPADALHNDGFEPTPALNTTRVTP